MKNQSDILIIGGGAVGVCSAYFLHRRGYRVTLLEKDEICAGCSHGNAGLIVPSHSVPLASPGVVAQGIKWMFDPESPFYIKPRLDRDLIAWLWKFWLSSTEGQMRRGIPLIRDLSLASLALFDELTQLEGVDFGYHKKGLLDVYNTEEGFEAGKEDGALLGQYGVQAVSLRPEEIQRLLPGLRINMVGGILHVHDAHLTPGRFVRELARYLETRGVDIRTSTEVLGLDLSGASIATVKTTRGDFSAGEVVVTAGAWSRAVSEMIGMRLPIQPAKGYSVTVKRPPDWPETPMVMAESRVAVTPMMDTLRFGGTLELAGFDFSINRRRVDAILKAVPRYLPDVKMSELEVLEVWRGWRPCTPDGLPFLGRPVSYDNLTVAAGHAMKGISLAPITGKLVSEVISGEKTSIDISALRIERFD